MASIGIPGQQYVKNPEQNRYVRLLARLGFFSKGAVYGLLGVLALMAAWGQGKTTDGQGTLKLIGKGAFGDVLLVLIGVGLSGYALWRFIECVRDPRHVGSDGKGIAKRLGYFASGLANGALAYTAFELALLGQSTGGGQRIWIAKLMAMPLGQVLVGALGAGIVVAGLSQIYRAYAEKFMDDMLVNEMSSQERSWTLKLGKVGLSARGVVLAIVGVAICKAAINHSPRQARGVGGALRDVGSSTWGSTLLTLVALGFIAYAIYMLSCTRYRKLVRG